MNVTGKPQTTTIRDLPIPIENRTVSEHFHNGAAPVDFDIIVHTAAVIWRRKWLIAATGVLTAAVAAILLLMLPARYQATAFVQVDVSSRNAATETSFATRRIQSFARLMQTDEVARRVVKRLELDKLPSKEGRVATLLTQLKVYSLLEKFKIYSRVKPSKVDLATRQLMGDLRVQSEQRSNIISVTFTGSSPTGATRIANGIVDEASRIRFEQRLKIRFAATHHRLNSLLQTYGRKHPNVATAQQDLKIATEQLRLTSKESNKNGRPAVDTTDHILPAYAPTIPVGQNKFMLVGISFMLGVIIAIGIAFYLEYRATQRAPAISAIKEP